MHRRPEQRTALIAKRRSFAGPPRRSGDDHGARAPAARAKAEVMTCIHWSVSDIGRCDKVDPLRLYDTSVVAYLPAQESLDDLKELLMQYAHAMPMLMAQAQSPNRGRIVVVRLERPQDPPCLEQGGVSPLLSTIYVTSEMMFYFIVTAVWLPIESHGTQPARIPIPMPTAKRR